MKRSLYGLGLLAMILSVQTGVSALPPPISPPLEQIDASAPEIDGSSISAGLGLLTAAVLIVRSRSRK